MTATRAAATTATLLALAFTLTACGDDDSDAGPTPEAAGETATTSEATTAEAAEPLPSRYPEVGLTYENLPELDGPYRDALEAFIAYDRGRLKLLREARMNPMFTSNAGPSQIAKFSNTVDYLVEHDTYYRGSTVTTFRGVRTRGRILGFDLCLDGSGLRWIEDGQPVPVPGEPREVFRIVVTQAGGQWKVTGFEPQGTC